MAVTTAATVTSGAGRDPATGGAVAWIESRGAGGLENFRWTLCADGALRLDYAYSLDGAFAYHGITFA